MTINEIRKANFDLLFDRFKQSVWADNPTAPEYGMLRLFAERLGLSQGYASHINTGYKAIGTAKARRFEELLKLPDGWMDVTHGTGAPLTPDEAAFVQSAMDLYRLDPTAAQSALLQALSAKLKTQA